MDLLYEVAEHLLADLEVGNHSILEGTNCLDVARGTPDHALGIGSDSQYGAVEAVDGHHRRVVEDHSFTADIDQRVGST